MTSPFFFANEAKLEEQGDNIQRKILAYSTEIMAVEVIFKKGSIGVEHQHENEQISYVLEGEFEYSVNGEVRTLKTGDSVHVDSNVKHGCKCIKDGKLLDIFTPYRKDFLHDEN